MTVVCRTLPNQRKDGLPPENGNVLKMSSTLYCDTVSSVNTGSTSGFANSGKENCYLCADEDSSKFCCSEYVLASFILFSGTQQVQLTTSQVIDCIRGLLVGLNFGRCGISVSLKVMMKISEDINNMR